MPIQLPDLDNATFKELMDDIIAKIPKHSKAWTNFNISDPGITILELLAFLSEALIYRADIIPDESYMNFLRLIAGSGELFDETDSSHKRLIDYLEDLEDIKDREAKLGEDEKELELLEGIEKVAKKKEMENAENELKKLMKSGIADLTRMKAEAQAFLKSRYRAVSKEDFEALTLESSESVKRVFVSSIGHKIEIKIATVNSSANHTDLGWIITDHETITNSIKKVHDYLAPRRLIGTYIRVKHVKYTPIELEVRFKPKAYVKQVEELEAIVKKNIEEYINPITGGPNYDGWPLGRDLMLYELFHLIEKTEGVDHVIGIYDGKMKAFKQISIEELPLIVPDRIVVQGELE